MGVILIEFVMTLDARTRPVCDGPNPQELQLGRPQASMATAPGAPVMDPVQKESQDVALAGKPYISNKYGPPRPAFQEERLETIKAIKAQLAGQPPDPNISEWFWIICHRGLKV